MSKLPRITIHAGRLLDKAHRGHVDLMIPALRGRHRLAHGYSLSALQIVGSARDCAEQYL